MDEEFAFPHTIEHLHQPVTAGMTLRDYFAAKVVQGICASKQNKLFQDTETLAKGAYVIADAMLKARGQACT